MASFAWGQPALTTIEDTVYRADGRRFDGTVSIEYRSFLAADSTLVAAYSKNIRVVNGALRASLVPTTTASAGAYYLVRYNINGRLQFTEFWSIPQSATAVKLKDIRLSGPAMGGGALTAPAGVSNVTIGDVAGLTEELQQRIRKAISYSPSRTAVINLVGDLDSAVGDPTDCVRVNGTAGPCNVTNAPSFVDGETPAGLVNGTNAVFTLADAPVPANSLMLYRNGVLQRAGTDFSISSNTVTFTSGSHPQNGDLLAASYRLANASGQTGGAAGGALSGYYPAPAVAAGAIANQHIAENALIAESKLALAFPTHSNANDPTTDQKGGLTGTAGQPSSTNRFVTDTDPRMNNARTPAGHALLSGAHVDVNPGVVSRGDLIVGVGTSPVLWSRLPLGAANRCLTSNGFDAAWNACLHTGFPQGSLTFVDSTGALTHNQSRLFWDNSTRRFGIGTNAPSGMLTVHDAAAGNGVTTVVVRAGEGQQATALQKWQDASGSDLAQLGSDGSMQLASVNAASSATKAAWTDSGSPSDPTNAVNGGLWWNSTESTRKTMEAGQTHAMAQVICSLAGTATSATTFTSLATCHIPAGLIRTGDRLEIRYDISHEGGTTGFSYAVFFGGAILNAQGAAGTESAVSGRDEVIPQGASTYWNWTSWGAVSSMSAGTNSSSSIPEGAAVVEIKGQMSASTAETVTLRNLSVIRWPGQQN
ncbi:MAG: hypothetical protein HYZ37_14000 [Candidatus Solibacter usitatus]|nr:hypothetical protein [Candidatus Solibacter usitatus]